jgi:beta-N-acetylhexosaminidase
MDHSIGNARNNFSEVCKISKGFWKKERIITFNIIEMTISQKIAQLFSPAAYIHDTEENIQALEQLITNHQIGGLTFFHSRHSAAANFEQRQEVLTYDQTLDKLITLINRYQKVSQIPLLISIDAEFGLAMRIEKTPQYPYAISVGALTIENKEFIKEYGFRVGNDLRKCGIHLNFAPVADINSNPNNPVIGYRSFGTDKEKVSEFAIAFYQGMKNSGISGAFKHFPGHGDTAVDSHLGLPILNKSKSELYAQELYPFVKGIEAGVEMIMVGHLAVPALTNGENIPASISYSLISELLKGEMGFNGIVVTDALNMKALSGMFETPGELEYKAFAAGNDLLCFSENVSSGIDFIKNHGDVNQIEQSFEKIMTLKSKLINPVKVPLDTPSFDFNSVDEFNKHLANQYIGTIYVKDAQIIKKPKIHVSFGQVPSDVFKDIPGIEYLNNIQNIEENLSLGESLLISLFIPSAKPVNHFGLSLPELDIIGNLALKYQVILCLFGNPLAIPLIPHWKEISQIIGGYQDFKVNQEVMRKIIINNF